MKVKKIKVRTHKKPKTKRIYTPVANALELCRIIESHGEKTLFSYFTTDHRLADITYFEFSDMIKKTAAGLDSMG